MLFLHLAACVDVPSSGRLLEPAKVAAGPSPSATSRSAGSARATGPQGDFDFDADGRPETPEGPAGPAGAAEPEDEDPLALQARLLGLSPDAVQRPAPAPPAAATVSGLPLPTPAAPIWDPSRPLPDVSFGVRVLAVLLDLQPPRAVLGLPDGREQVVTPGAMLPAEGLVVLAIGRDAVQVARVTPAGFYARVDTETIRALYPQQSTTSP